MKKKIISIILILVILQYFCIFVFAEETQTNEITNSATNEVSLEDKKQEVEDKIEDVNTELEYVQDELSATLLKVQEIEDKIMSYEKDIEELGNKMQILQASIDDATARLQIASQSYEEKSDLLAKRLVAIYESGDIEYLDVLLNSKNITDFLSRYYVIQEIVEYDSVLIKQVQEEKENIDTTRQKLENEQGEIKILKAKSEQTSIVLGNMKTLQQSYINDLSDDEKKLQEQITAFKQEQAQIEAQKAQEQKALEAKRLAQQEAQRKAQIEAQKAQELKAAQERQAKLAAQQEAQKKAQLEAQRKAQEQKQVQQQAVKTQPKTVQTQTNTPKPAAADIKPVQPKVEPAPKEQIVEKTNNEQAPVETSEPSQEEQILTEDLTEDLQANEQMEQIPDTNDTQITQASFIEILKDKLSPIKPYYYIIIDNPIIIIASLVAFIGIIMLVILNKNRKKGQNMQDNTPAYDDTNQEQPLEQQTSSEPETSDTSVNQTEEDEVQSFKDEFKELAYDNPDTQDNTESTVEETQQEEIEEIQTPVEPEEEPYVEPKVLSSIKVASDRGFLLVDRQGTKALFGFINEDVFFLYQFKEYISDYEIKFRIAEKQSDRIFFIVKVDKFKLLVKVTRTSMQLELEM